jgi:catechol 2,3-dioxygenase-like lactoylglutathione lyase family enzyme
MPAIALDHVNIMTDRLDETCSFYTALFDLDRRDGPLQMPPDQVQWLYDGEGRAIFHINAEGFGGVHAVAGPPQSPTGHINHVALTCPDLDGMLGKLDALDLPYRTVRFDEIGLTQVFVSDPNEVLLELSFRDNPIA